MACEKVALGLHFFTNRKTLKSFILIMNDYNEKYSYSDNPTYLKVLECEIESKDIIAIGTCIHYINIQSSFRKPVIRREIITTKCIPKRVLNI